MRTFAFGLVAAAACSEAVPPPMLIGDPAPHVEAPADPSMPDLGACNASRTDSAITVINEIGQLAGYEVTNTDAACPRSPAPCGAWWAQIVSRSDENHTVTFATQPAGDLCETHVSDSVVGRVDFVREDAVTNGTIYVIDLCLVDEHGHVATGEVELFAARGRGDAERPPCE